MIEHSWRPGTYEYSAGFWIDENEDPVAEPAIEVGESFWFNKAASAQWHQISSVWP